MIKEANDFIGTENLEYMALQAHKPLPAVYVFVDFNGKIVNEIRNERRIDFNSKFRMMNYYSELVSIQKPIKSKLVFSNNYLTFFCRNTEKLTVEDIDEYFLTLGTPKEYNFFTDTIKQNIWKIAKEKNEVVRFFLLASPGLYRKLGLENWSNKAISQKTADGKGFPISCSYNSKKPYQMSKMYLVDIEDGLRIKLFYDILKGLKYRGYDMLVVGENNFIPLKSGEFPKWELKGCVIFAFDVKNGKAIITHMDTVPRFTPWL